MTVLEWVYYARFGSLPPDVPDLDKELRRLEATGLIYHTRVDGKKCHRRLTAAGAAEVNRERQARLDNGKGVVFELLIPAG